MLKHTSRRITLVLVLAIAGCASGGASTQSSSPDTITQAELSGLEHLSAYEVVRRLHPNWLRARGQDSFRTKATPRVYLNGVSTGDVGSLRSVSARAITRIDYLDARAATLRFGTDHSAGAILVATSG